MAEDDDLDEDGGEEDDFGGDGFEPVVSEKDIKKPYEVDFQVHTVEDIQAFQKREIAHVAGIIGCLPQDAATMLRAYKWNKERLVERYMEDPQKEAANAGVVLDAKMQPKPLVVPGFECPICYMDDDDMETLALQCGHRFCRSCYENYLNEKVTEQGESRRIQCMEQGCGVIVDERTVETLVAPRILEKYNKLLLRTYVDDSPHLKWCPAPDCEHAVECHVPSSALNEVVPTVHCQCGHAFCFGCSLPDHQPSICFLVRLWLKKCADDSETSNWISANTKECTKCMSTIEKNGGCNHMTCKRCKYEFCWVCLGPWTDHGSQWYNCNRYDEKASIDARDSQAKSRQALERYLHYYNRYANHEQSAKLSADLLQKTAVKMEALQASTSLTWIEVQFLRKAVDVLLESRMTLKWTYSLAYYLRRDNMTELFEDNQRDLEIAVEALNELLERPVAGTEDVSAVADGAPDASIKSLEGIIRDLRQQVLDKMGYVRSRREVLLTDTARGLKEHRWQMNVDLQTGQPIE
ncbi:hypothetical protein BC832DRAFT_569937 [Gaertneriomyces semiglobifer]|nr:hypothetical protein BC832DRAFT_569937 [Gaertneriomyces semiglobifer]